MGRATCCLVVPIHPVRRPTDESGRCNSYQLPLKYSLLSSSRSWESLLEVFSASVMPSIYPTVRPILIISVAALIWTVQRRSFSRDLIRRCWRSHMSGWRAGWRSPSFRSSGTSPRSSACGTWIILTILTQPRRLLEATRQTGRRLLLVTSRSLRRRLRCARGKHSRRTTIGDASV